MWLLDVSALNRGSVLPYSPTPPITAAPRRAVCGSNASLFVLVPRLVYRAADLLPNCTIRGTISWNFRFPTSKKLFELQNLSSI